MSSSAWTCASEQWPAAASDPSLRAVHLLRCRCGQPHAVWRWGGPGVSLLDMSSWGETEAEQAFGRVARARRRAALVNRLRRRCTECLRLAIHDERALRRRGGGASGIRDIPLDAISGTLEPSRASQFDRDFRPAEPTRSRWQRVWLAEHRGALLPPISVVQVGSAYAVRDGHHRVSVAKARGALTITAIVDTD